MLDYLDHFQRVLAASTDDGSMLETGAADSLFAAAFGDGGGASGFHVDSVEVELSFDVSVAELGVFIRNCGLFEARFAGRRVHETF